MKLSATQPIDLPKLLESRLLVQANSGGGKSWCLRRLLEQSHGKVQQFVIDPEGEFSSLREKYDYVLAARQGGDTSADPRIAKLLAERLLELGASAILDIYELKTHERIRFVRGFLEALVDAPKRLWHPALVVLDEAHVYCPQQGNAESAGAVIDLATRGRKRGFCSVLATQRLSKLHKDAAAECNNKLIGRTGLDVDVKRACDELGFGKERWRDLRRLGAGKFFAFGPAISTEVVEVHVGPVKTTHPEAGGRIAAKAPPPRRKIKALLPKLADLPTEAEERRKTNEDLKRELNSMRGQLSAARRAQPEPKIERIEIPVIAKQTVARLEKVAASSRDLADKVAELIEKHNAFRHDSVHLAGARPATKPAPRPTPRRTHQRVSKSPTNGATTQVVTTKPTDVAPTDLTKAERAVLSVLAQHPEGCEKGKLALLSGYKWSGGFRNTLSALRTVGLIEGPNTGVMRATPAGTDAIADDYEPLPQGRELAEYWLKHSKFGACERAVLKTLLESPEGLHAHLLAEKSGYTWSGGFRNSLSKLRTAGVIEGRNTEVMRASEHLL